MTGFDLDWLKMKREWNNKLAAAGERAGKLQFSREQMKELRYASLLHDFGKILFALYLPEPFREVVMLRCVAGFSYRDVADILGCPAGTVMSTCESIPRRRLVSTAPSAGGNITSTLPVSRGTRVRSLALSRTG